MDNTNLRQRFVRFCTTLYERHLVTGIGGNVAIRDGDRVLVTPTGASLRALAPDEVVVVDLDGKVIGPGAPSKEITMHLAVLRAHPDATVACHVHGSHLITASCMLEPGDDSLPPLTPGYVYYAYPMPLVPFAVPGTPELVDMVADKIQGRRAVLLQNHGLVTVGRDIDEALNIAEEVDEAAQVFVLSQGQAAPIPAELRDKIF